MTGFELATEERHPLPHTDEAVSDTILAGRPAAGVCYFDFQVHRPVTDHDARGRWAGVLERVRQRLLDDSVRR
jgi:hypothetical protein